MGRRCSSLQQSAAPGGCVDLLARHALTPVAVAGELEPDHPIAPARMRTPADASHPPADHSVANPDHGSQAEQLIQPANEHDWHWSLL